MTVRKSSILINVDEDGSLDIDINNLHPSYVPEIVGSFVREVTANPFFNPSDDDSRRSLRRASMDAVAEAMGENTSFSVWRSLTEEQPVTSGPFWCIERGRPNVYTDMYWDNEQKMFGTRDGDGYAFITHWMPPPRFIDKRQDEERIE